MAANVQALLITVAVAVAAALVLGGAGYALYRVSRTGPMYLGDDGETQIQVIVTFIGVRGMPWWYAIATNNAAPLLVIYPDTVLYRVFRKRRRPLSAIERIDVNKGPGTVNLSLQFRGDWLIFSANLRNEAMARAALLLLPRAAMTARAVTIMDGP